MNTKLTLSLDSTIIRKAKIFAEENKTSLSKIVENYFRMLFEKQTRPDEVIVLDEDILKISGDIELAESINTKNLLSEQLIKKYIHD